MKRKKSHGERDPAARSRRSVVGESKTLRESVRVSGIPFFVLSVCSFYLLRTPSRHPSPHNPDPFVLTVPSHHHHHHPNQASDLALIRTSSPALLYHHTPIHPRT